MALQEIDCIQTSDLILTNMGNSLGVDEVKASNARLKGSRHYCRDEAIEDLELVGCECQRQACPVPSVEPVNSNSAQVTSHPPILTINCVGVPVHVNNFVC
jgi:hypothetical protein